MAVVGQFDRGRDMPKSAPAAGEKMDDKTATAMMPGAELLLKALEDEGVEVVFGYPGGAVLPIYDALFKNNKIRHILVRHEPVSYTHLTLPTNDLV